MTMSGVIPACDGRADRWTHALTQDHRLYRAIIVSRGKNQLSKSRRKCRIEHK